MKADLNVSVILRRDFNDFLNLHRKDFEHVFMNFNQILFIKNDDVETVDCEIYSISGNMAILLPEFKYIIVASESYNFLHHNKQKKLAHILKHIPKSFNGEIVPHEVEHFVGEDKY